MFPTLKQSSFAPSEACSWGQGWWLFTLGAARPPLASGEQQPATSAYLRRLTGEHTHLLAHPRRARRQGLGRQVCVMAGATPSSCSPTRRVPTPGSRVPALSMGDSTPHLSPQDKRAGASRWILSLPLGGAASSPGSAEEGGTWQGYH